MPSIDPDQLDALAALLTKTHLNLAATALPDPAAPTDNATDDEKRHLREQLNHAKAIKNTIFNTALAVIKLFPKYLPPGLDTSERMRIILDLFREDLQLKLNIIKSSLNSVRESLKEQQQHVD